MPSRSASNTALVVHDRNGRMIKLKCDYSSLAEMFGRSRDPITSREHRGRGGEGWTVYDEPGIPRTMEKKKRGKSEERERVADWLDRSRQEAHTLLVIQVIQRYGYWSTEFRERINERERERESWPGLEPKDGSSSKQTSFDQLLCVRVGEKKQWCVHGISQNELIL